MFDRLINIFQKVKDLNTSVDNYQHETDKQTMPSVAYINRAKKLVDKKMFDEALKVLNQALEISPKDALVYKYIGIVYERLGDIDSAINSYRTSANINPQDKNIWQSLGMLLVNSRQYVEAEKAFEQANKVMPVNTDIQGGWGMALFKQYKYKEAHEKFLKAIQLNRYNFSAMLLAAVTEIRLKMYDDAEEKLKFLLKVNPTESCTYEYANLCFLKEDYEYAIHYAKMALELNKNMLPAYLLLGKIYSIKFDYENATEYFNIAKDNDLISSLLYKEWGDALVRLFRFLEAKEMFHKALLQDVEYAEAQAGLALCSAEVQDFEKATDLIKIAEGFENVYLDQARGVCAFAFGETQNAIDIFKKVLSDNSEEFYCYYRLAKCYEKLENDEMARDAYDKFIKFRPEYAYGYLEYAKYLISKPEFKDAQRKLRKAATIDSDNQEILNLLFYVSYVLVKEDVCEYNIKEAISLADKIRQFKYPEYRAELQTILENLKK